MSNVLKIGKLLQRELSALEARGAKRVVLTYDGIGDEGGTESVVAELKDGSTFDVSEKQFERLAIWAWKHVIPDTGWWNDEGGYGTVSINLDTWQATIEHCEHLEDDVLSELPEMPWVMPRTVRAELRRLHDMVVAEASARMQDDWVLEARSHWQLTARGGRARDLSKRVPATLAWILSNVRKLERGGNGAHCTIWIDAKVDPPTVEVEYYKDEPVDREFERTMPLTRP